MTSHRGWVLSLPANRPHVADRPRRCEQCDAPVLLDSHGVVIDDTPQWRYTNHGAPGVCRASPLR